MEPRISLGSQAQPGLLCSSTLLSDFHQQCTSLTVGAFTRNQSTEPLTPAAGNTPSKQPPSLAKLVLGSTHIDVFSPLVPPVCTHSTDPAQHCATILKTVFRPVTMTHSSNEIQLKMTHTQTSQNPPLSLALCSSLCCPSGSDGSRMCPAQSASPLWEEWDVGYSLSPQNLWSGSFLCLATAPALCSFLLSLWYHVIATSVCFMYAYTYSLFSSLTTRTGFTQLPRLLSFDNQHLTSAELFVFMGALIQLFSWALNCCSDPMSVVLYVAFYLKVIDNSFYTQ